MGISWPSILYVEVLNKFDLLPVLALSLGSGFPGLSSFGLNILNYFCGRANLHRLINDWLFLGDQADSAFFCLQLH